MGKKNKLKRWADLREWSNCFEQPLDDNRDVHFSMKGKWKEYFKNDNPIVLELGCGKGEYSVGMGRKYKDKNFIGVDIKGARIWYGAKASLAEGLTNVAFLRTRIEFIDSFFDKDEISEIWITFPDPQLKDRREKKRLTHMNFLNRYRNFLKEDGVVHLKTDSAPLHEYTKEVIAENKLTLLEGSAHLYKDKIGDFDKDTQEILEIKTYYEELFVSKGFDITYLKFKI